MLTLSLLRHAKSSWDDPRLDDHERPLAKRGATAADAMGTYMAGHGIRPDLIMCSDAARARATMELVLPKFAQPRPKVVIEPLLYLAPATTMLTLLRQTRKKIAHLMVVGHNPGMHALALELVGRGLRRDIATLAIKFPTCGLAVLEFEASDWAQIRPASGLLKLFLVPRQLD